MITWMLALGAAGLLAAPGSAPAPAARGALDVPLDDFEDGQGQWKYVGGEEFPGARGSLQSDSAVAHGGTRSLRLTADFSGGGAYVGVWRDLAAIEARDVRAIRLWVKADGVTRLGVRLNDSTGQCHQQTSVPLASTDTWQEIVLRVGDIVGGEHWGGANDGRWHGPAAGFGLHIGRDSGTRGTLWLDDAGAAIVPPGKPTILTCTFSQPACRPAYGLTLTHRWDAEPMGRDYKPFVHFLDAAGRMAFQADYELPGGTAQWTGRVERAETVVVPTTLAPGDYAIVSGLWNPKTSARLPLKAGAGVTPAGGDAWKIGTLRVAADAPIPPLGKPTLNLDGYRLTFDEDFTGSNLSVSAWGPGTRWIAHTPYAGDFGDARFADPAEGFPFTVSNGVLRIEARQVDGKWKSGLLASADRNGSGFAQQYGYFEMRAKFPKGPGTWPAFWLLGLEKLKDKSKTGVEIDIVEQYGVNPNSLHTCLHLWYADKRHRADPAHFIVDGMSDGFHRYGAMVTERDIAFYFDGVELRRIPTPAEARAPLYLLVNLALGGGWPIEDTPNPSYLFIDYVRAYAKGGAPPANDSPAAAP